MNIMRLNKKIETLNSQLRKLKIKKYNLSQVERKKRARNLIILGANFEILGYEKEDAKVILGFLKETIYLIEKNREHYFKVGNNLLEERKRKKEKQINFEENRKINDSEIKVLLNLSKNYDISSFIKNNFKKNLWEHLTLAEFNFLKDNID